jgi:hypothetical protein
MMSELEKALDTPMKRKPDTLVASIQMQNVDEGKQQPISAEKMKRLKEMFTGPAEPMQPNAIEISETHTPNIDIEALIEDLNWRAAEFCSRKLFNSELAIRTAAQVIRAQQAEIERLKGDYARGIEDAAKVLTKKQAEYDAEFGLTDYERGLREYPTNGDDMMFDWYKTEEEIRALLPKQEKLK